MSNLISGNHTPQHNQTKQHKQTYLTRLMFIVSFICFSSYTGFTYAVTANPDTASVSANSEVEINVLKNDTLDNGSSAGSNPNAEVCLDPQQFNSACSQNEFTFNATSPTNGTLALDGNIVTYTPNEEFVGQDSFTYTVYFQEAESQAQLDDTTVTITVNAPAGPTEEEQSLINAVTSLCSNVSENESEEVSATRETSQNEFSSNCNAYNNLSEDEKANALVTLAADQVTAEFSSTVNMTRNQSANISSRLTQLKNNTTGLSVRGLTIHNYEEKLDGDWLHAAYSSLTNPSDINGLPTKGGSAGDDSNNVYTPFGFFINGSITLGDKKSSASERGYDIDSDNYTLGMDYRYSDQLVVGAAYGYSSSSIEFNSTGDDMDNQVNNLFVYGSLYEDNFFFSTTLGYAFGEIDTSRRIFIQNILDTQAKGSTDTNQFILQLNSSYDISHGALSFGPYAKLDIIEGEIEGYQETNGGGFEVAFDDQDISSQLLTLGGQAQYALSYSWGVLLPSARFELKNEFNDSQDAINGRFVFDAANTNFSITADKIDNRWYVLGTGLSAVFPHGLSAYVDFETTSGLSNLDLYTYSYGGRWELSF